MVAVAWTIAAWNRETGKRIIEAMKVPPKRQTEGKLRKEIRAIKAGTRPVERVRLAVQQSGSLIVARLRVVLKF